MKQDRTKIPDDPELRQREERLSALNALAGQMAHDFNNFLVPIHGYLSLIREDVEEQSMPAQYAHTMSSAVSKTEKLLDAILMATRPNRKYNPDLVPLDQLVQECLTRWSSELPSSSGIQLIRKLDSVEIQGDPVQLKAMVDHLLSNAHFALATGGTLEVELREENWGEEQAQIWGVKGSKGISLVFEDDGLGMSPEILMRAFDPFFTTRSGQRAKGLGLAIVYGVVRMHGGQVLVRSAPNQGTRVELKIPYQNSPPGLIDGPGSSEIGMTNEPGMAEKEGLPRPAEDGTPALKLRLLLVDDDPMVLEVIRSCLVREGMQVVVARNGKEALRALEREGEAINGMISDITMPEMSGLELAREVRLARPEFPVLLISGDAAVVSSNKLPKDESGSSLPILKKPFPMSALLQKVKDLFGKPS